MLEILLIF